MAKFLMHLLTASLILLSLPSDAEAGRRCWRQSYHSLQSTAGWSHGCYSCHKTVDQGAAVQRDLLGIAKAKQTWTEIRNGLSQLGFEPSASGSAYGQSISGEVNYAPQGSTVYGYSSFASNYGSRSDLPGLYNQAARLTTQAQTLAGQAATEFSALVEQEGANQATVASIVAQGQAAERALIAARGGTAQAQPRTFRFEVRANSDGQLQVVQQPQQATVASSGLDINAVIENKCVSCHSGEKPKGGFDLSKRAEWTSDQWLAAIEPMTARVTSHDPAKRMPLGADNQPGEPLTSQEIGEFYRKNFDLLTASPE